MPPSTLFARAGALEFASGCSTSSPLDGQNSTSRTEWEEYSQPDVLGFSRRLVDVDGAQIEVYHGGAGRVVVCGSHPHSPRPEDVAWYAEHAQVVYIMPRGHGRSSPVQHRTEMQLETVVRDLEAVRRQLRIGRWVLEGYSGGSQLALTYALNYPDALAGLIIGFSVANIAAGALADPRSLISPAYPAYQADLSAAGFDQHAPPVAEDPRWVQLRPDLWVLVQGQRPLIIAPAAQPGPHFKVHLEEVVHFDVSGRLREIRVPTQVICGRRDPIVPIDGCAAIRDGIPGAELLVLDQTAHGLSSADEADVGVFRRKVKQFLVQVEGQQLS
jgi:proline iminopeptidase